MLKKNESKIENNLDVIYLEEKLINLEKQLEMNMMTIYGGNKK